MELANAWDLPEETVNSLKRLGLEQLGGYPAVRSVCQGGGGTEI